eukprot:1006887-Pelagomonas_calceolata.AAC.10
MCACALTGTRAIKRMTAATQQQLTHSSGAAMEWHQHFQARQPPLLCTWLSVDHNQMSPLGVASQRGLCQKILYRLV